MSPVIDLEQVRAARAETPVAASLVGDLPAGYREVPLEHLHPHPQNPRRGVGDVTELADSIREHGIRQALLAVPDPGDPDRYRLVIGHRRRAAAEVAGLETVPVLIDPTLSEADQLELMLVENVQRSDLTAIEEADGYQGLLDLGVSVEQAAKRTGRSESTVRARLKLVALPEVARAKVHAGEATLEQAARLPDPSTLTKKQYDKLVSALGSSNYGWQLQEIERAQRNKTEWAKLEAALAAAGIEVVKQVPDGYKYARHAWGSSVPEDAKSTWVFKATSRPSGEYWRPPTKGEKAADKEAAEQQRRREEEQVAEAERTARAAEVAEISAVTRREFIVHAVARKNPKAPAALVEFLGRVLVARPTSAWGYIPPGDLNAVPLRPEVYAHTAGQWFGLDVEALAAEGDQAAPARAFVDAWLKASAPARLLALLATAVEPLDAETWAATDEAHPTICTAWYDVLVALGYEPSTAETEALAGRLPEVEP